MSAEDWMIAYLIGGLVFAGVTYWLDRRDVRRWRNESPLSREHRRAAVWLAAIVLVSVWPLSMVLRAVHEYRVAGES